MAVFLAVMGILVAVWLAWVLWNARIENERLNTLGFPRPEGIRATADDPSPWITPR